MFLLDVKVPSIVVSLGGIIQEESYYAYYASANKSAMSPAFKLSTSEPMPYLEGSICLVSSRITSKSEGRKSTSSGPSIVSPFPGKRVDVCPNPVDVIIQAEDHSLREGGWHGRFDFTGIRMTYFDKSRLVVVSSTRTSKQIGEVLAIYADRSLFPSGVPRRSSKEEIKSILWYLKMAARVYTNDPESIQRC